MLFKRLLIATLLMLSPYCLIYAEQSKVNFERLSLDQGLSHSSANAILQDHLGFIWVGTEDGLNRYDGYSFTIYRHDAKDVHSLSNNSISTIFEDKGGNLWVGTKRGGLNRYNRETDNFTAYRAGYDAEFKLEGDNVFNISQDRDGTLWVITGGLNKYNPKTKTFTIYKQGEKGLGNKGVTTVFQDKDHRIWVATWGAGIYQYFAKTDSFKGYKHDDNDPQSIGSNKIMNLLEDNQGNMWLGTKEGGLNLYNADKNNFTTYHPNPELGGVSNNAVVTCLDSAGFIWVGTDFGGIYRFNPQTKSFAKFFDPGENRPSALLNSTTISSIIEDNARNVWIGTWGNGIYKFDIKTSTMTQLLNDTANPFSLSNNQITALYKDRAGLIWIASWGGGLNKYDANRYKFAVVRKDTNIPSSLNDNEVNSICVDYTGRLWVGTRNNGLNRYSFKAKGFVAYKHDDKDPNSIVANTISHIFEDSKNRLWIGTEKGLDRYNAETDSFIHYSKESDQDLVRKLNIGYIHFIAEDSDGSLLLGYAGGGGMYRFNPETNAVKLYPISETQMSGSDVYSIYVDRAATIWAGTYDKGLNRSNTDKETFKHYKFDAKDPHSLSDDRVTAIYQDQAGTMWIGTSGGLNRYIPDQDNFIQYTETDGLPNASINGILEDKQGNLWISTNKGISKLNPQTNQFTNYDINDGLQSNEFYFPAYFKSRKGEMFFGGNNGFNRFYPEQILSNQTVPPIVLTSIKVFGKVLEKAQPILMQIAEKHQATLELAYNENFFAFEFVALNYTNPEKNRYSYKLIGLDKDWVNSDTRRYANYTNLNPGEYTFQIKGSNNDGIWNNEGISLKIIIHPPPWLTWWAYGLYFITFSSISWAVFRFRQRRLLMQLEMQHTKMRAEAAEIASQAKGTFLANMSHELRTPLNAILGFTQLILRKKRWEESNWQYIKTINQSGEHLLSLINNVLTVSKIEVNKITLNNQIFNLHKLVEGLMVIIQPSAQAKGLKMICEMDDAIPEQVFGDDARLRQVLINLLGNAIKFTSVGQIKLVAEWRNDRVLFQISDTGFGIAEHELTNLFEPFYQTAIGRQAHEGTGLGLSISRYFVQLMGGELLVTSELNLGSCFSFEIDLPQISQPKSATQARKILHLASGQPAYRILIVDDRWENREVLKNLLLSIGFNVAEATNGQEAVMQWRNWQPHLIFMDMRMKVMDGYGATAMIRDENAREKGAKVVIIALTASVFDDDHARIYAAGCDDIIIKPYLEAKILESIGQHLAAEFIYEGSQLTLPTSNTFNLADHISKLPQDLLKQLYQALLEGQITRIKPLIDLFEQQDSELASELRQMVKTYRIAELLELVSKKLDKKLDKELDKELEIEKTFS